MNLEQHVADMKIGPSAKCFKWSESIFQIYPQIYIYIYLLHLSMCRLCELTSIYFEKVGQPNPVHTTNPVLFLNNFDIFFKQYSYHQFRG